MPYPTKYVAQKGITMTRIQRRTLRMAVTLFAVAACVSILAAYGSSKAQATSSAAAQASSSASASSGKRVPPHITIGYVDIAATVGTEPQQYSVFKAGADALGWKVILADAQNSPTRALQATQAFVTQHVNAIVFDSVPASYVNAALLTAKAAHIPTIELVSHFNHAAYTAQYTFNDTAASLAPIVQTMKRNGVKSGSQIGFVSASAIFGQSKRPAAVRAAMHAAGYTIVATVDPSIGSLDQSTQNGYASMIRAHPAIKAIVDLDGFANDAWIGMKMANASSAIQLYPWQVTNLSVPTLIAPHSPVRALVYPLLPITCAIALDKLLDYVASKKPLPSSISVADSKIVTAASLPRYLKKHPDSDAPALPAAYFLNPYLKIWAKTYVLHAAK